MMLPNLFAEMITVGRLTVPTGRAVASSRW
jgi:hypothetical protein